MTSARTSGVVSGAAQGAAAGMVAGPWGAAAGAVIGGIGGYISGSSRDAQFKNQQAWSKYNANMQYATDRHNIETGLQIAGLNAAATMAAARSQASSIMQIAEYNSAMINATTNYNSLLMNRNLEQVWEAEELELEQLDLYRAREAGGILADQAASGTVINEGSNLDVMVSQETQRLMDAQVIMYNADNAAADIQNQMAQGRWQGAVAIQQTMYEGQVNANNTLNSAKAQAVSGLGSAMIQAEAQKYNAKQAHWAAGAGISQQKTEFGMQNQQAMTTGLFNAAAMGAQSNFGNKTPKSINKTPTSVYSSNKGTGARLRPSWGGQTAGSSLLSGL